MKKWMLAVILQLAVVTGAFAQDPSSLLVNEFVASNSNGLVDGDGANSDWVELYNPTGSVISLNGCYMTDDSATPNLWQFPASANISVPANGFRVIIASGNGTGATPYVDSLGYIHTSFRLGADGEDVLLVNTDGATVISGYANYPAQGTDISYGRGSNAIDGFFAVPTPGAANGAAGNGFVADTEFSVDRGFYDAPFSVEITCATPGATIKYTLDASTPSETNGIVYTVPIAVDGTTTLRAMAYLADWFPSDVDTQTYISIADTIAQPATRPNALWPNPTAGSGGVQAIDYGMDPDVTTNPLYSEIIDDALRAIPTIAVTTDLPNLFDATTGIYANPAGDGEDWERPAAVEMILGDGTDAFHVNAGLRIRGGVSRSRTNAKHSFRIIMRTEYGDSKIEYPLFGKEGAQEFDKLDFRTAQNFSWNFSGAQFATWLDDPFSRDTMRDLGHPYTRGFFFHLYLNGVYWGLYQTEERPDTFYAQSYEGGLEEEWDVVKSGDSAGVMEATDGTIDFYHAFWTQVNAGVGTAADYLRLQGKNLDGSVNPAFPHYLDAENLIDYMLLVFYTAAFDMPIGTPGSQNQPRNLYAMANRVNPDGFKWLVHDNEWSLTQQQGVNVNRVSATLVANLSTQANFNPWWLHSRLRTNPEYALQFADRVHKHFFNGGVFTPEACMARYQQRIDEIDLAIVAESARWGDQLSANSPRTRDVDWRGDTQWTMNNFFNASPSTRTAIVLGQLRAGGLYPATDAPELSSQGGEVEVGFEVTATATLGTIFYTTDGSDPRLVGGAVNPAAISASSGVQIAINGDTVLKARAQNGSTWSALTEAEFTVPVAGGPAVIVNEFLYADAGTTVYPAIGSGIVGDWVELLVVNGPADLRGWQLSDHNGPADATEGTLTFPTASFLADVPTGTIIALIVETGNAAVTEDLDHADGKLVMKTSGDGGSLTLTGLGIANGDDNIVLLNGDFANYPPNGTATTAAVDFTAEGTVALATNWGLVWTNPFSGIGGGDGCFFTNDAGGGFDNDDGNIGWVKDIQSPAATPGAPNTGQTLPGQNPAPVLTDGAVTPAKPKPADPLTFSVNVTDNGIIASVRLFSSTSFAGPYTSQAMSLSSGSTYTTTMAAQATGTTVYHYYEAMDTQGASATLGSEAGPRRVYVSDNRPAVDEVVINEISVKAGFAGAPDIDWIEIHNTGSVARDVSWMGLSDDSPTGTGRPFSIPPGTSIPAGGFILLVGDSAAFTGFAPWNTSAAGSLILGNVSFGFGSSGDTVALFDDAGGAYDQVIYDAAAPWDGDITTDRTAELIDASQDNSLRANWSSSADGNTTGSPGAANFASTPPGVAGTAWGVY